MPFECINSQARNQRGAALITVLFIAALVVTIIVSLVFQQQIDIRRTENIIVSDELTLAAEAVLGWGANVLTQDAMNTSADNLSEEWARGLQPTKLEKGAVIAAIIDMQGRFNLNNLLAQDKDYRDFSQAQFTRMLDMCGSDVKLVNAVVDWLDNDQNISMPGGAEDDSYQQRTIPQRTADALMVSPSELRLVAGFDQNTIDCLMPYISTLPEESYLNINTTSPFVLAASSDDCSLAEADAILAQRPFNGFSSVSNFFQNESIVKKKFFNPFLTVSSRYFRGTVSGEFAGIKKSTYALYRRDKDDTEIIQKSWGDF